MYKPFYTASAPDIVIVSPVELPKTCIVSPELVICNPDHCKYSFVAIVLLYIRALEVAAAPHLQQYILVHQVNHP